jgi:hypothetical protein
MKIAFHRWSLGSDTLRIDSQEWRIQIERIQAAIDWYIRGKGGPKLTWWWLMASFFPPFTIILSRALSLGASFVCIFHAQSHSKVLASWWIKQAIYNSQQPPGFMSIFPIFYDFSELFSQQNLTRWCPFLSEHCKYIQTTLHHLWNMCNGVGLDFMQVKCVKTSALNHCAGLEDCTTKTSLDPHVLREPGQVWGCPHT